MVRAVVDEKVSANFEAHHLAALNERHTQGLIKIERDSKFHISPPRNKDISVQAVPFYSDKYSLERHSDRSTLDCTVSYFGIPRLSTGRTIVTLVTTIFNKMRIY